MENYNRVDRTKDGIYYYLDNEYHRLDGPAIEYADGSEEWYENDLLHRLNGPAIDYHNGNKEWFKNGKLHRLEGPAVELINGYKEWWFEGKEIECNSQKEFERYLKLKLFW